MSGTGSLTKTGAGTLTLTSNNTYSGGTTITGGLVNFSTAGNLGSGQITLNGGGLQWAAGNTTDISGRLAALGAGGGTLDTNGNNVTLATALSGAGGLTKAGVGTLTLTGNNTYSGGTTVAAGTLQGDTTSLQGDIVNNANVTFNQLVAGTYAGAMGGTGSLTKTGAGTLTLTGNAVYSGGTTVTGGLVNFSTGNLGGGQITLNGGGLQWAAGNTTDISGQLAPLGAGGGTFDTNGNSVTLGFSPITGTGGLVKQGAGTLILTASNTYTGGTTISAGTLQIGVGPGPAGASSIIGNVLDNGVLVLNGSGTLIQGNISGTGSLTVTGGGSMVLSGANTYSGGTTVSGSQLTFAANSLGSGPIGLDSGALMQWAAGNTTDISQRVTLGQLGATFDTNGNNVAVTSTITGTGGLTKTGAGTLTLSGTNTYSGGTTVAAGTLQGDSTSLQGNIANNASVTFNQLVAGTYAGAMSGGGSLTKTGAGTLILTGNSSYSGGTSVDSGILLAASNNALGSSAAGSVTVANGATLQLQNNITVGNPTFIAGTGVSTIGALNNVSGTNTYAGSITLTAASLISANAASKLIVSGGIDTGGNNLTTGGAGDIVFGSDITSTGSLTKEGTGTLTLTGAFTYSGGTTIRNGKLVVNGSLAGGTITIGADGKLGGNATYLADVVHNGTIGPGNSIGTINFAGNFTQTSSSVYEVEINSVGQSDKINVGGTATIAGSVRVLPLPGGLYPQRSTYTILSAVGGVNGTYALLPANLAFVSYSLTYDPNNVFLTQQISFANGAQTANQRAVGGALDAGYSTASGDFSTVLQALTGLGTAQGPAVLAAISGQPYANFGSFNVASNAMFMNTLGQQMALARSRAGDGQRQALAQACDVSCDATGPLNAWASAIGGVGSVQGDGNAGTFTYNVGGTAVGLDYRVSPTLLVGLGMGYTSGTQWVGGFMGRGWSDTLSVATYASFAQASFYLDALAGYAYSNNQMQRQIAIPNLQSRTASGTAGANQWLGQVEAGYTLGLWATAPGSAKVTPFARLQASTVNQAGFSEWGANSLNLNVAAQSTASLRTTFGAELAATVPIGDGRALDLALRLGWLHEYADTARPMTAAFAGAPSSAFTVFGAAPSRDSALLGFSGTTRVASNTSLYLRYDGNVAAQDSSHSLSLGFRLEL